MNGRRFLLTYDSSGSGWRATRDIWLVRLALVLLSPLCLCIWIYCRIKFGAGYEPPAPRIMR